MKPVFLAVDPAAGGAAHDAVRAAHPTFDGVVLAASAPGAADPTVSPHLLGLLRTAREAGLSVRVVHTDGMALAAPGRARALAVAGANRFVLTWPDGGASADQVFGHPGAFVRAVTALKRIQALGTVPVVVRAVVARGVGASFLSELLDNVAALDVRHLVLTTHQAPRQAPAPTDFGVDGAWLARAGARAGFLTLGVGPTAILVGADRDRDATAFPADGDPYVFRAATGPSAPAALLVQLPRVRLAHDRMMLPSLGLARLRALGAALGYRVELADLDLWAVRTAVDVCAWDTALEAWVSQAAAGTSGPLPAALVAAFDRMWAATVAGGLASFALLGLSLVEPYGHFHANLAVALAAYVAERHPATRVILGGDGVEMGKVAGRPAALRGTIADLIDGAGEFALLGWLNRADGADRPPTAIVNRFRAAGAAHTAGSAPFVEVRRRRLPVPDFGPGADAAMPPSDTLLAFLAGLSPAPGAPPAIATLPYQYVDGCQSHCVFCNNPLKFDFLRPEEAARQMVEVAARTGVRQFFGLNTTSNLSARYAARFADALIRADAGLLWCDSARPIGIDPPLAQALRAAGCVMLTFGLDAGSDRVLKRMNKGFTLADAARTFAATAGAGIVNRFNLMVGFPFEDDDDVAETLRFINENRTNLHSLSCYNPFYLNPWLGIEARGIPLRRRGNREVVAGSETDTYDEIGGRPWETKRVAVERDFVRILEAITAAQVCPHDVGERDVFALRRMGLGFDVVLRYLRYLADHLGPRG